MTKALSVLLLILSSSYAFASQTYFSCSMPVTGGYALEGQEFAVVIKTDDKTLTILGGSSDPIYQLDEVPTTNFMITGGGPNGWPQSVIADYTSTKTGAAESLMAVFKVGKVGRPAIIYSSSEDSQSFELQCY